MQQVNDARVAIYNVVSAKANFDICTYLGSSLRANLILRSGNEPFVARGYMSSQMKEDLNQL